MPHRRCEPTHGFEVVVENLRVRREDCVDGLIAVVEIGHEHFDGDARIQRAHRFDGLPKMFRAAIGQIVARHRRDDDVVEPHPARGFRDPPDREPKCIQAK